MAEIRKRVLFWAAISLTVLGAVLFIVVKWPPQRNLLLRSQRVLALPTDPTGGYGSPQYYWQSGTQLVTSTFDGAGFAVEAVDLSTHTQRPIASLSAWIWLDDQWNKTLSPDGQWALASVPHTALFPKPNGKWAIPLSVEDYRVASDTTLIALSDRQGRQKSTQAVWSGIVSHAFWLPDSRHWAIILHTHNGWFLQVHDRTQPKSVTLTPIQHNLRAQMDRTWADSYSKPFDPPPGITRDGDFISVEPNHDTDKVLLLRIRTGFSPAGVELAALNMPFDSSVSAPQRCSSLRSVSVSPDGKSVAWVLDFQERQKRYPTAWDNFREQWVNGQMPLDPQPYPSEEVWVSGSNGSKMHELAYLAAPNGSNGLTDLRWMPSGQQMSFVYKDNLYTMPATDRWRE